MRGRSPWKVGQLVSPAGLSLPLWINRQGDYYESDMTGRLDEGKVGLVVETYVLGDMGEPDWVRVVGDGGVGWNRPWNFVVVS